MTQDVAAMQREIERLREALYDIAASQMIWNGGIGKHKADYLYGFIEELRDIARAALTTNQGGTPNV